MNIASRGRPRTIALLLVTVVSVTTLSTPAAVEASSVRSLAAGEAEIGYWTETEVIVTDGAGAEVRRYQDFPKFSLNGGVLAGEIQGRTADDARIVAWDIATGERLYRVTDARLPVVAAEGRKLAFYPAFKRDKYTESIWMRTAAGRLRKVIQFKAGPGYPGVPHGMSAGAFPLDIALDERGRTMAVVAGLEPLRAFDVWVVDVKTKAVKRMTRGENSHNPSMSPDGSQLAVRVESPEPCPDDFYGEILVGKLRVFSVATGEQKTLTEYSCDLFYDTPRWIDDSSLAAIRVTKDDTEEFGYDLDLVRFDVATGAITELVTEGNPCCLAVSASLGKIAYSFSNRDGFAVYDVASGTSLDFPGNVFVPHLSGENRF